ncbi:MAG: peptidoglycan DD-metalloendopeptidase family protein [Pseudomonadales bacterium]
MRNRWLEPCDVLINRCRSLIRLLCVAVLGLLLVACANNNFAPVRDLERPKTVTKGSYTVRPGDTLYSIAWRFGRDYRELARANGIRWPYTIYKGQRINLGKPVKKVSAPAVTQNREQAKPQKTVIKSEPKKTVVATQAPAWHWPAQGTLIGTFSPNGANKGIDIKAREGQAVRAAADGTVVYAGSGLVGYGNLVIIKHSEVYLSAYAHNRRLLVREQKKVKAGEKIAEIGSSGTNVSKLHFEIRKNGKPVNPLWYLPKTGS